jgi:ABC-type hemin transport system ATPase subunit
MCLKDGKVHCEGSPQEITPENLRQVFGTEHVFVHRHD